MLTVLIQSLAAAIEDKLKQRYRQLLDATGRVVGQAKRFSEEIVRGVKRSTNALKQLVLEGLRQELDEMTVLVKQVMKQTRARIFRGTRAAKTSSSVCSSHRLKSFARARQASPTSSARW